MQSYSPLLYTLHDQPSPIGNLGRGVHYSVLQYLNWFDLDGRLVESGAPHKFAVIWDEDHDIRIVDIIEGAILQKVMQNVLMIGERKGSLSVLLNEETSDNRLKSIAETFSQLGRGQEDSWPAETFRYPDGASALIRDSERKSKPYLEHIVALWDMA